MAVEIVAANMVGAVDPIFVVVFYGSSELAIGTVESLSYWVDRCSMLCGRKEELLLGCMLLVWFVFVL